MISYRYLDKSNSIVEVTEANGHVYNILAILLDPTINPTPYTVTEVKRAQALRALAATASGNVTLYDEVMAWVATQSKDVQIDFNARETFAISHPAIQAFKTFKVWTDQQLQDLFNLAATF